MNYFIKLKEIKSLMETSFNQVFEMIREMKREFKTEINEVKSELKTIEVNEAKQKWIYKGKIIKDL